MARSNTMKILVLYLSSFALKTTTAGRNAAVRQSSRRKIRTRRRLPKYDKDDKTECLTYYTYSQMMEEDPDPWYDWCIDQWKEHGPSVSPSISSRPSLVHSSFPSIEPSSTPSSLPSTFPSLEPSIPPSTQPSSEPSIEPSQSPIISPSSKPSLLPSSPPSLIPSSTPSLNPTDFPSVSPSKDPSTRPSVAPTNEPSISHIPSLELQQYRIALPTFHIELTFKSTNLRGRRSLSSNNGYNPNENGLISETKLYDVILLLLSSFFDSNITNFHQLDLRLSLLYNDQMNEMNSNTGHGGHGGSSSRNKNNGLYEYESSYTITYRFSGDVILEIPNGKLDASTIPSVEVLQQKTLDAFSKYRGSLSNSISESTNEPLEHWVVTKVSDASFDASSTYTDISGSNNNGGNGVLIALSSGILAIISTMTAFGLIYKQLRSKENGDHEGETPTKLKQEDVNNTISKARKFRRSPFLNVSPPDGTRKYFSKLDDDSVNSRAGGGGSGGRGKVGRILNPNQSMVDSSFDESSYAESLQAPSMTGSKDLESLAGMSALDDVRLHNVLRYGDDDGDEYDDRSLVSVDTGVFRRIWYGHKGGNKNGNKNVNKNANKRPKMSKENSVSSIRKLSPPSKDTPTKQSPLSPTTKRSTGKSSKSKNSYKSKSPISSPLYKKETKKEIVSVPVSLPVSGTGIGTESEVEDNASLLGNQSTKDEYYTQNEESSALCYNKLRSGSVVSESSEDIDFNQMYIANSSCYTSSDIDTMSRGSRSAGGGSLSMTNGEYDGY